MFGQRKILVEIYDANGLKSRKKYPIEGNKVVISRGKAGRGNPAYKPTFDSACVIPYSVGIGPFKLLKQKMLLIENADKCISFSFVGDMATVEMPVWDKRTEEGLMKASVIKAAGATMQRIKIPIVLYLILIMIFGLELLNFLLSTGRVRFG